MKLSKYAALAKREAYCDVFRVQNNGIWMGLRGAIYRAGDLPEFSGREQTRAILSFNEKQMDKIFLRESDYTASQNVLGYDLRDYTPNEQGTNPVAVVAAVKDQYISALRTDDGELLFYNEGYLLPLYDVLKNSEYMTMTVRRTESGQRYIAVKDGFHILAILLPVRVLCEKFLADLQEFEALCTEQFFREKERAAANSNKLSDETRVEDVLPR